MIRIVALRNVARSYRGIMNAVTTSLQARISCLTIVFALTTWAGYAQPTPLPDDDLYGGQTFSPTVELLLAGGNALLAGYNGYLLAQHRRRSLAGGIAVVTGAIGIAIGMRETANYPVLDLAMGGAAVLAGGAQVLMYRPWSWTMPQVGTVHLGTRTVRVGRDVRPALALRFLPR